jgi:hypothetical protein
MSWLDNGEVFANIGEFLTEDNFNKGVWHAGDCNKVADDG